ncbi:MAG: flagellar basal body P-ring protein FlgI [Azospirillaceae bacterium]|nr:flagellar basal body P-ring protein FlgI [Azospirillaceae bacterium]
MSQPFATDPNTALPRHAGQTLRRVLVALLACGLALLPLAPASAASRIKDVVQFEGVRSNMLVGYGLAVGLSGTGDSLTNSPFTQQSLVGMLERMGINTRGATLNTKNVAAVMVTASLPAFAAKGNRIDVQVSTLGDATSLLGGVLLVTPLMGADSEVYAVAQGSVAVAGYSARGQSASVTRGVPTAARISNGAIVEREVDFQLADMQVMRLSLLNPDFTTATRIAQAINGLLGPATAEAIDPATVALKIPPQRRNDVVGLVTEIEQLRILPDQPAKVVIDEQSGVIVMGENVRINTVAVAQGNLTIKITETPQVSQPGAFANAGSTVTVPRTGIAVDDSGDKRLGVVSNGVTLQDLVQNLNALGIGPRDMITILQSIKAAGALQADIELM